MSRFAIALSLFLALALPGSAKAWTRDRVLVIVDNRSSNARAAADIVPAVQALLEQKGYEVVRDGDATSTLSVDRGAGVPAAALREAAQKLRADAVVAVSIGFLLEGKSRARGPNASAAIGVLAKMYSSDGRTVWRNSVAAILEDSSVKATRTAYVSGRRAAEGAKGDGVEKSPTTVVCEQLLWTLPHGRPDPAVRVAKASAIPAAPVAPVKATRFEAAPERARSFGSAAHFPLRLDRSR